MKVEIVAAGDAEKYKGKNYGEGCRHDSQQGCTQERSCGRLVALRRLKFLASAQIRSFWRRQGIGNVTGKAVHDTRCSYRVKRAICGLHGPTAAGAAGNQYLGVMGTFQDRNKKMRTRHLQMRVLGNTSPNSTCEVSFHR